jgi:uncharacterized membrane protein YdbT with pleckstrin-like domain
MDMQDLDEAEKARRKKEQIEWRTKKNNSNMFMIITSLVQIVFTILVIALLITIASLIMFNVMNLDGEAIQVAYPIVLIALFVIGVFFAFFFYKKLTRLVIKKMHLEDKLLDDVLEHYKIQKKSDKENEIQEQLKQ